MSDWVIDNDEPSNTQNMNPSEWEIAPEENESPTSSEKRNYWDKLKSAPGKIFSDVSGKIAGGIRAIPDYFQKAKSEVPGILNPTGEMWKNPGHALGQGVAGLNEQINSIAQFPLDVSKYGSERLGLLPQGVTNAIQKITPEDTSQAINQLFGQPQYPGEALLRGAGRNIVPEAGIAKIAKEMPHLTKRGAVKSLNQARQLAENRDIGTLNVNPELIEDARQFLPNTLPHRNALEAAQRGDYNNLFRLQSDVGKNSSDYARSLFSAAERSHGRAGLEARNRLLDAIHENLQIQGHHDISDLLRQGQNDYRRYMAFKPYRNALALGTFGLAVPHSPITAILKRFLSHNIQ